VLERLADAPGDGRAARAERLLAAEMPGLGPEGRAAAIAEAERVLTAPFAAAVFGPASLAEVAVAIPAPGEGEPPMLGRIDRLVLAPGRADIVDIKTDAAPPAGPGDVPAPYLAQLAAYSRAVAALYPGRAVRAQLLWTAGPALMTLPPGLLAASGGPAPPGAPPA
jgi:ATP-dependent helicase/nuclease subunit A